MNFRIHAEAKIGHVHLTVSDLDRAIDFYRNILGFEITQFYGRDAVFLSAGNYHHHIGLNTWAGKGASPPPFGHTGLYHFAICLPDRKELAKMVKRLYEVNYKIEGASDHGVSESIYLKDPDNNGIEIYRDRPESEWPIDSEGNLNMITRPLDLMNLLSELD